MAAELTDTQRRFLISVIGRLSRERVREVYLFSPLKQGGVETGVAVIAAGEGPPPPAPSDGALRAAEASDPTEAASREADVPVADDCVVVGETVAAALDSGDVDEALHALTVEQPAEDGDDAATPPDEASEPEAAPAAPPSRFTIFTARYRLQLKGPDRGKWEVDVVEEADAPLVTVDAVVRGVQRRAGELSAVERLSGDDLDAALDEAPWARR